MGIQRKEHMGLKLDLGCGLSKHKPEGFIGVDIQKFPGVDQVCDLRKKWPWKDGSVEKVLCSHFVEHLTNPERIHFWNELYRVLMPVKFLNGQPIQGKATIVTPNWSHASAYGVPTHQWPPLSEWTAYYLDKNWRALNAPHVGLTCDFIFVVGGAWDEWLNSRQEKTFAMGRYINSWRDMIITLHKREEVVVSR